MEAVFTSANQEQDMLVPETQEEPEAVYSLESNFEEEGNTVAEGVDFSSGPVFVPEDLKRLIADLSEDQLYALEVAQNDFEYLLGLLGQISLGYWSTFLAYEGVDTTDIPRRVYSVIVSPEYQYEELGITIEQVLYQFIKHSSGWIRALEDKGCKQPVNVVEVLLFNGLRQGIFNRLVETLKVLLEGKARISYFERVCECYNPSCLFCRNGIQYFPSGTSYTT